MAATDAPRSGAWRRYAILLLWAGLATVAAFAAASPFFFLEPTTVVRDFRELREVDIDRAVGAGLFSSLPAYLDILLHGAAGAPVFVLGLFGALASLASDWRRGLLLVSFPLAFLAFVSNTFPATRYLNIVLPCLAVAAACGAWRVAALARRRAPAAMALVCVLAALPGALDSARWDLFFGRDDTRMLARAFIERNVPANATVLVQPYSAPIRQSRAALVEALSARLGDPLNAPLKYRLQLAAASDSGTAYRVLYLGDSGKAQAPPGDVDKVYISARAVARDGTLDPIRAAGITCVVLTRYGPTLPVFQPLEAALRREARQVAMFSPYRNGLAPEAAPVPPFRHNSNTWIHPVLERPGPIVEIWRLD